MTESTLEKRRSFSKEKLSDFGQKISELDSFKAVGPLCIYTTGSYGRLEASPHSDLDLFFVTNQAAPPRLQKTLLDADLIKLTKSFGLPAFSGDGEYLTIHRLADIQRHLGSPEDDYQNFFTARLLLLLESRPLAGNTIYDAAVKEIVQWYFRDYGDHAEHFRPIFLTNDVIRFWKTLCLNYEHKRNDSSTDPKVRAKHRLKNLKLKFSRLTTCFSTLIAIAAKPSLTPEALVELVRRTPWERLDAAADDAIRQSAVRDLKEQYAWFLDFSEREPEQQREDLLDAEIRGEAFRNAEAFGASMYDLLVKCTTDSTRRYLIV